MNRSIWAMLVLFVSATAASAQPATRPVFPPPSGGIWQFTAHPNTPYDASDVPMVALTRSLGAVEVDSNGVYDTTMTVACVNITTARADQESPHTLAAPVADNGAVRRDFKAVAYKEDGCTGEASDVSEFEWIIFMGPPGTPTIGDSGQATAWTPVFPSREPTLAQMKTLTLVVEPLGG